MYLFFFSIRCSTSIDPKIIQKRGVKALKDKEKFRSIVRFPQVGERGRSYVSTGNDDGGTRRTHSVSLEVKDVVADEDSHVLELLKVLSGLGSGAALVSTLLTPPRLVVEG